MRQILALVAAGQSYSQIGRQLDLSKNTVLEKVKREHAKLVTIDAGLREQYRLAWRSIQGEFTHFLRNPYV